MKRLKTIIPALLLAAALLFSTVAAALPPSSDDSYAGIDISKWQGEIDFAKVAQSGVKIVYIRVGANNDYEDPFFERNYASAKAAGLKIGFYFSMTAQTEADAVEQADFFTGLFTGKTYDCIPAMDYGYIHNLTAAQANANALAFLNRLKEKTGGKAVIYTDASDARSLWSDAVAEQALLWVAQYGVAQPEDNGKWSSYVGWQYSNTGRVNGINGNVDLDLFTSDIILDEPAAIPGDKVPAPVPEKKLIHVTVQPGDTLSALARRYDTTVNAIVKLNNIPNPDLIYVEQVLYIQVNSGSPQECVNTYTVKRGDTLWKIAKRFGTTVNRLAATNEIRNVNLIIVGQVLDIGPCASS